MNGYLLTCRQNVPGIWEVNQKIPLIITKGKFLYYMNESVIFKSIDVLFFSYLRKVRTRKIMSTVLEGIGDTPLVRINRIGKECGLKCEICE